MAYKDAVLLLGSCFAATIGGRMTERKMNAVVNPFGTLFNPISISHTLKLLITKKKYSEGDLTEYEGTFFSWDHSHRYSSKDEQECLRIINQSFQRASEQLMKLDWLILTLGSAWVYEKDGAVVANCHKLPQKFFKKRLLDVQEIAHSLNAAISQLQRLRPEVNILFTLSPVRHWKDGVVESQRSKATLHLAIQQLVEARRNCFYFPAYEILLDELRDYRFYEADMLHPSEVASDYIWQKFTKAWLSTAAIESIELAEKELRRAGHRRIGG